ncbi:MAG: DEAD/DEAH box helicase [Oceanibulbus sp.]|nr:DEAD/DEAH box helicase [Sulfitobacter sp.]|tara:strand:+ start:1169 stop:4000 length:2832 start_codon:yes stop_codon:yes gene_type:complete
MLMPRVGGEVSITDAQYDALSAGLGDGASLLVSAPTSTGKTLIGWWAAASALEQGKRVVYLVSHRALASQKFEEIQSLFLKNWVGDDTTSIVCATGDGVYDATGRANSAPLAATILVATYEKYLALVSAGGPPQNLRDVVFVCDEVQLIGDGSRGKHVELLLSVLKRTGWHQFIGLSAVMDDDGAVQFSNWLDLGLVQTATREKTIRIEARWANGVLMATSTPEGNLPPAQKPHVRTRELNEMIQELLASGKCPVIVFCMKVDDTYDYARKWGKGQPEAQNILPPIDVDLDASLLELINKRCAFHNAEMGDDERAYVESLLENNQVDVVFATSTLAAGVNFPLGSAIFSKWKRWNFEKKMPVPIRRDEFQNMAGRVGRMGQAADEGTVLATAETANDLSDLSELMDFSKQATLGVGITPEDFGSLIIQLFAGGLCATRKQAFALMSSTLSAQREAEKGDGSVDHWMPHLHVQIERLISTHCLIDVGTKLVITEFGKAVARAGIKPESAEFFLQYLSGSAEALAPLLPTPENEGRDNDLLFIFTHGSLLAPEFDSVGGAATRFIHWRLGHPGPVANPTAERLNELLFERPWVANPHAANGARVVSEWASGAARAELEEIVPNIRMGTIHATARDVSWLLFAISQVISSASSPTLADEAKHPILRSTNPNLQLIRSFARVLRRYSTRVAFGLPSECHWLRELELNGLTKRLSRKQIVSLHQYGLSRPHLLMDGSPQYDVVRQAAVPSHNGINYPNLIRDAAKNWKVDQRRHYRKRHANKAKKHGCDGEVTDLYEKRGKQLEAAITAVMKDISVVCSVLDDGVNQAWPDLKIEFTLNGLPTDVVAEVKSKEKETSLVPLNDATEVLSASELAGMPTHHCITVCSPGVEPSVPTSISGCRRLSVVEIVDLAEAYLRVKDGNLSIPDLYNWLTTPGIALTEDLPFKNA